MRGVGVVAVPAGAERETVIVEEGEEQVRGNKMMKHLVGHDQFTAGRDDVETKGSPRLAARQQVGPQCFRDVPGKGGVSHLVVHIGQTVLQLPL